MKHSEKLQKWLDEHPATHKKEELPEEEETFEPDYAELARQHGYSEDEIVQMFGKISTKPVQFTKHGIYCLDDVPF